MVIETATQTLIIISLGLIGISLSQLWKSSEKFENQMSEFRTLVVKGGVGASTIAIMNVCFGVICPFLFALLVYWAGFATWVASLVFFKYLVGAFLSYFMQKRFIEAEIMPSQLVLKMDQLFNFLLIAVLLILVVKA